MKVTRKKSQKPRNPQNGRPKRERVEDLENDFDLENFEIKNSLNQLNQLSKKGKKRTQNLVKKDLEESNLIESNEDEDEKELELYLKMKEQQQVSESESESDVDADQLVPVQFANQTTAILSRLEDMRIPGLEFMDQVSLTSSTTTSSLITTVDDDLSRELAFYQQALEAAKEARTKILEAGVPFSRPTDYFAEMVKSDEHMVKVREKLLAQENSILESEKAKKQRDLKKFGKQVQVSKLLERQKEKKVVLEKVKGMRRKGVKDDVDFDVQLEETSKPSRDSSSKPHFNKKRAGKNAKFGYGGAKRHAKQNTRESTSDLASFSVKKMKSGNGAKKVGKKSRK